MDTITSLNTSVNLKVCWPYPTYIRKLYDSINILGNLRRCLRWVEQQKTGFCFLWSVMALFCLINNGNDNTVVNLHWSFYHLSAYADNNHTPTYAMLLHSFCFHFSYLLFFYLILFLKREIGERWCLQTLQVMLGRVYGWLCFIWYFLIADGEQPWHSNSNSFFLILPFLMTFLSYSLSLPSGQTLGCWAFIFHLHYVLNSNRWPL